MKKNKLTLILLLAALFLHAGCSRPADKAPVVTTSPTPIRTEEEKKQEAAGQRLRSRATSPAATTASSPSATP